MKKDTDQSFIDQFRPRHKPLEDLQKLMSAPRAEAHAAFTEYRGTFASTSDTRAKRPSNLVELYLGNDIRAIAQDAAERPDHYDARQHAIIAALSAGKAAIDSKITDLEMNDLLLQWMRPTEIEQKSRKLTKKEDDDDVVVMEDGRTLSEHLEDEKSRSQFEGTFQDQDSFGDKIIL